MNSYCFYKVADGYVAGRQIQELLAGCYSISPLGRRHCLGQLARLADSLVDALLAAGHFINFLVLSSTPFTLGGRYGGCTNSPG